jgi:hypothetical protein
MKTLYLLLVGIALTACGTMQSIVKSSFPYTATLTIPALSETGKEYSAISMASSFDQNFVPKGNDADHVNAVRVVSAKLHASTPNDYEIGQLSSVQIYLSKADGKNEQMVAWHKNISPTTGNELVLDIDNSRFIDDLIRQRSVRMRMVYKLRNKAAIDVSLQAVLNIAAYPDKRN